MGKALYQAAFLILLGQVAFAQSLVPATSEDMNEFDRQISAAQQQQSTANSVGKVVSEEAKKKKELSSAGGKGLGNSSAASSAKDARVSAPKNNDRGNSSNAPGRGSKK